MGTAAAPKRYNDSCVRMAAAMMIRYKTPAILAFRRGDPSAIRFVVIQRSCNKAAGDHANGREFAIV